MVPQILDLKGVRSIFPNRMRIHIQFSLDISDIFEIHMNMEFWFLQMGIYSHRLAPRLVRCDAMQIWWYACGPEYPRLWNSNLAMKRWEKIKLKLAQIARHSTFNSKTYLAWMVYETSCVSTHCCINDQVIVNFEHIATNATAVIVSLTFVRQCWSDQLSSILNHHFTYSNVKEC